MINNNMSAAQHLGKAAESALQAVLPIETVNAIVPNSSVLEVIEANGGSYTGNIAESIVDDFLDIGRKSMDAAKHLGAAVDMLLSK